MTHQPEPILPPELRELEAELRQSRAPVGGSLGLLVQQRVAAELISERRGQRQRWLLAAAAVLLVGLHLSWWGAQSGAGFWAAPQPLHAGRVAQLAAELRALAPELSEAEAVRQARLAVLAAGRRYEGVGALPRPYQLTHSLD
ncbi:MAG: hypothetical protein JNG90_20195 [Planctomycetaceae bacterium]|nr:hypothetical protein [Planctomycetaceae bacterium]